MATEVSCGQCHGRLLVETLGVVVACPHCGVHLSIPAPPPAAAPVSEPAPVPEPVAASARSPQSEPAPQSKPVLDRDTDVEVPSPSDSPLAEQAVRDPGDIEVNLGSLDSGSSAASDSLGLSSIFGSQEESSSDSPDDAAQVGWHSAPNLSLGSAAPPPAAAEATPIAEPAVFTAPVIEPNVNPAPPGETDSTVRMFASFGEAPPVTDPAPTWNFAPAEAATPTPEAMYLSSTQQFMLEPPAAAAAPAQPTFSFGESATSTPTEAPLPTGLAPAPLVGDDVLSSSQQFVLDSAAPTFPPAEDPEAAGAATAAAVAAVASPASALTEEFPGTASEEGSSRVKFLLLLLIVVGSYASAVTMVLIYTLVFARPHPLESLPDVKPPMRNGEIAVSFYSPKNDVPSGHVLALGQSERYGNVRVTPIRVTRGPVRFEHYSGQRGFERSPSDPVFKLWMKFENVSNDQTFAPLDSLLLFRRKDEDLGARTYANNFLCAASDRRQGESILHVFDLPVHSEFRMSGQNLDRELKPGESLETFVPSEEAATGLKGDLVWRIHFRKGYHPQSFRGVTTLIDVTFNRQDVTEEQGAT